jgi:hypothetical protein
VICYCKREIADGARTITLQVTVDWGSEDERESVNKGYVFCSFKCVAEWASDRARDWDGVVVHSPAESHEELEPRVVDTVTETAVR